MTTYKSDAATSGLMPDYSRAGVVLCRSAEYTITTAPICPDIIEMVPIPKGAQILDIFLENTCPNAWASCNTIYVGDGNDRDRFFKWPFCGVKSWTNFAAASTLERRVVTGNNDILHTYSEDDTIDIYFGGTIVTGPTGSHVTMHVFYKMDGSISDESF